MLSDREKLILVIPLAIQNSHAMEVDSNFTYKKLIEMKAMYPSLNDGEILELFEEVAKTITEVAHHALKLAWEQGN